MRRGFWDFVGWLLYDEEIDKEEKEQEELGYEF